jgi:hypothetical protein
MSISTWPEFLSQLTRLLDGEDSSQTTIAPNTLNQVISLGERRIYREVQSRWNEVPFVGVTTTNNLAPLPADFESPRLVNLGYSSLEPVAEEFLIDQLRLPITKFFCISGNNFQFAGPAADGTAVVGRYFARLPGLSITTLPTNNLFLNEPDLFIFSCLAQAAPFFGQDARLPMWEGRYTALRDAINQRHQRSAYSSGRLKRRPSAILTTSPRPNYGEVANLATPSSGGLDGGSP